MPLSVGLYGTTRACCVFLPVVLLSTDLAKFIVVYLMDSGDDFLSVIDFMIKVTTSANLSKSSREALGIIASHLSYPAQRTLFKQLLNDVKEISYSQQRSLTTAWREIMFILSLKVFAVDANFDEQRVPVSVRLTQNLRSLFDHLIIASSFVRPSILCF